MEQRKDLWELVRQKLDKNNDPVIENPTNEDSTNAIQEQKVTVRKDEIEDSTFSFDAVKEESNLSYGKNIFLNQGIFAGFVYILTIMIVLGILMIPGSITAAIGGYFGGRKSGDPARALTAAMLPFLIIASISVMGSIGALPPGSGPNDLSDSLTDFLGYSPDNDVLGPLSKMPDSNSSVFLSLVAFGFIGGLVEIDQKKKLGLN